MDLSAQIRDVPDFPVPGIVFKDITPMLGNPAALSYAIACLADGLRPLKVDRIVGIESRGFIFGVPLALQLGVGFSPVRKPGKLPWRTHSQQYALEYGTDTLQIHIDAARSGERVAIVDDLLATGGTMAATVKLVEATGAQVVVCAVVIELEFLKGRERLGQLPVQRLLSYD